MPEDPDFRVIDPERLPLERVDPRADDLWYSVRRYYVDEFYTRRVAALAPASRVLDVGGKRTGKRGQFDIEREAPGLRLHIVYLNLDARYEPDIVGDACDMPVEAGTFDAVILSETAEHLPEPARALGECARVLRPGGVLLAGAPFLYPVHPDPLDVGRYAPDWWTQNLRRAGFIRGEIERQGMFLSVLADMLRAWGQHLEEHDAWWPGARRTAIKFIRDLREGALHQESRHYWRGSAFYGSYTTGFGVWAERGGR